MRSRSATPYVLSSAVGIAIITAISVAYVGLPLWIDELHTSWSISGRVGDISERAAAGNQSPLYFYLLNLFTTLTGHTETSLRVFSVVCAWGSVLALNWICRRFQLPGWAAFFATVTFAASHLQLLFAVEARSYSLLTLLVLLLLCVQTLRIQSDGKQIHWRIEGLWLLTAGCCIYTHYIAIPAVGSLALASLLAGNQSWRDRGKIFTIQIVVLALFLASQFSTLQQIYHHRSQWAVFIHADAATPKALLTTLPVISTLLIPGALLLAALLREGEAGRRSLNSSFLLTVLILTSLPYLASWTTTRMDWVNWFFPRYLVTSLPALSLFGAFCLAFIEQNRCFPRLINWTLIGLTLLVFFWLDSDVIHNASHLRINPKVERWDLVATTLNAEAEGSGTILLAGGLVEDRRLPEQAGARHTANLTIAEYCRFPLQGIYTIPDNLTVRAVNSNYVDLQQLLSHLSQTPQGWLVARGKNRNIALRELLIRLKGEDGFKDYQIPGKVNLYSWTTSE